jgi:hypothetical protein
VNVNVKAQTTSAASLNLMAPSQRRPPPIVGRSASHLKHFTHRLLLSTTTQRRSFTSQAPIDPSSTGPELLFSSGTSSRPNHFCTISYRCRSTTICSTFPTPHVLCPTTPRETLWFTMRFAVHFSCLGSRFMPISPKTRNETRAGDGHNDRLPFFTVSRRLERLSLHCFLCVRRVLCFTCPLLHSSRSFDCILSLCASPFVPRLPPIVVSRAGRRFHCLAASTYEHCSLNSPLHQLARSRSPRSSRTQQHIFTTATRILTSAGPKSRELHHSSLQQF